MKFNELNIKEEILKAIEKKGFESMTDIQSESIPVSLEGRDILGQAQTGTGKTAAFAIPVLEQLDPNIKEVQSLILVPTRELALQVHKEILSLGEYLNVKSLAVFGGDSIDRQIRLLKERPQVVVGTPGRCIDLINRKKLKIHAIKFFCLDEVDEMLNMGFIEDVEFVSNAMPKQRQTLLFSATMPERIQKIAQKYLTNPQIIKVKSKSIVADRVEQSYIVAKAKQKPLILKNLIDLNSDSRIIVFTQTKRSADQVVEFLNHQGMVVGKIHGDLPQKNRTTTIQQFRDGRFKVLVATDVVARGIDIDDVNLVINYELPQDIEYYIHRIGRTARGVNTKGRAITLVTPNIYNKEFKYYSKQLKVDIKEDKKPELKDVIKLLKDKYCTEILKNQKEAEEIYKDLADDLLEQKDGYELITLLLSKLYPQLSKKETMKLMDSDIDINEDRNQSKGNKGNRGNRNNSRNNRNRREYENRGKGKRNKKPNSDNNKKYSEDKAKPKQRKKRR